MRICCEDLLPLVKEALKSGQNVRISVYGSSMLPSIYSGDIVEIAPLKTSLKKGDVVLAKPGKGRYVLHRIVRIDDMGIFLRGDIQDTCDGPLEIDKILGLAVSVERGKNSKKYILDSFYVKIKSIIWLFLAPYSGRLLMSVISNFRKSS